jgi:hypothetical protein
MSSRIKCIALVLIVIPVVTHRCHAQANSIVRIETIRQFVNDLQSSKPNNEIFMKYLASQGDFRNDTSRATANGFTNLLRTATFREIQIYQYNMRPETSEGLKSILDESPSGASQLEFTLDTNDHKSTAVDTSDLYVLKLPDQRIFILFDDNNRMISYFGIKWGNKVSLVEF